MRLILLDLDNESRRNFHPLALSRALWQLRCGMTSLGEKLVRRLGISAVAATAPAYMAGACHEETPWLVNDPASLKGEDLLLVHSRLKAEELTLAAKGPGEVGVAGEEILYARVPRDVAAQLDRSSIEAFLAGARATLPNVPCTLPTWNFIWDLMIANPEMLRKDYEAAGRSGNEGTVLQQPVALRGNKKDFFIAPGAIIHPMVVIDASGGPVYIDEGAEIQPFTRIEGPCYVGRKTILLGAKCREGNSIGPMCRIGGEVEESIIQGYSNKYHDGFLGHAYVGSWVNLGAMTANSDLKNDYTNVSVVLDGKKSLDTGATKVGCFIGDHTKSSIGTLFNTGAYVGAMSMVLATGRPLTKFIPSFCWLLEGRPTPGHGKQKAYDTARQAMQRRKCAWTPNQQAMWDAVYDRTAAERDAAIARAEKKA